MLRTGDSDERRPELQYHHGNRRCSSQFGGVMAAVSVEGHDSSSSRVKVEVLPRVCLHDAPTSIKVTGLAPDSPVTLTLTTHNDAGKQFHSFVHYVSDANGKIDVEHNEAVGGAYCGIFPAGLFSSLKEYPYKYTRLQKEDPTTPWTMTLVAHEGHLTLEKSTESKGMSSALLERHIMAPGVRRQPVVHNRVRGTLFFPAGPGPHPAVVDIFGGFGGLKEYRASMLASRGFACLAIAYFKYADLPEKLTTMDLEYLEEAVEYLLSQPDVIPDRCGVLSSSRGSQLGLAMGIYLSKITAVVCIGGVLVADVTLTYRGKELWKAASEQENAFGFDKKNMVTIDKNVMKKVLTPDHPSLPPCETAPEDTHFLMIVGEEDGMPSCLGLKALESRMKRHGREAQSHSVVYAGAGHIIEPPYNTHAECSCYNLSGKTLILGWGGNPWGTCRAQEDNWHNMRKFINIHVRDRSPWYQEYIGKGRVDGTW